MKYSAMNPPPPPDEIHEAMTKRMQDRDGRGAAANTPNDGEAAQSFHPR